MNPQSEESPEVRQTAIALFRRWYGSQSRWLVLHEERTGTNRLVEAERLERESFRESLDRELAWQLDLRRGKDYLISSVPRLHFPVFLTGGYGCSADGEFVSEVVEFYVVELFGAGGRETLDAQPAVRWWSAPQLLRAAETGGTALDPRQRQILTAAEVLIGVT